MIFDAGSKLAKQKPSDMWVSFRVTQLYETGAAVYVYFSIKFDHLPMEKVVDIYEEIEVKAREEVLRLGGSISHHHGVGKLRKRFMAATFQDIDMQRKMFNGIKQQLDPKNIFACNNTLYKDEAEREKDMAPKAE
jgi:alkyldihydroxyacetonephosphate synthase